MRSLFFIVRPRFLRLADAGGGGAEKSLFPPANWGKTRVA